EKRGPAQHYRNRQRRQDPASIGDGVVLFDRILDHRDVARRAFGRSLRDEGGGLVMRMGTNGHKVLTARHARQTTTVPELRNPAFGLIAYLRRPWATKRQPSPRGWRRQRAKILPCWRGCVQPSWTV